MTLKCLLLTEKTLLMRQEKKYFERKKEEDLDVVNTFEKHKKAKKRKSQTVTEKITDCNDPRKTKMTIEFNDGESASYLLLLRKKNVIKAITRFMSGKLLTFAKLSLKSFIYKLTEILFFPNATVKEIYKKYKIERIIVYHILTDTDSTSLQFIILSYTSSNFPESKIKNMIFEVIVKTEIFKRFDTCHFF